MNKQTLFLIAIALLGMIVTPFSMAKSFAYLADKSSSLKRKFSSLCEKNGCTYSKYEGSPELIEYQGYRRPKQRRLLMRQSLDRVRDQFLSIPPARKKDAALSNLERRVNIIKQVK